MKSGPEFISSPKKGGRLARAGAALAMTAAVLVPAACSGSEGDSVASRPTTTVDRETGNERQGENTVSEFLKNNTLASLDQTFTRLMDDETCADVTVVSRTMERDPSSDTLHENLVAIDKNGHALEMSRMRDGETGEVKSAFGRLYIPGDQLSAEERASNTSSDNPDGNRYGSRVRVSTTYLEGETRFDATGELPSGEIYSTQGDILGEFSPVSESRPMVAAQLAQDAADEIRAFVGGDNCPVVILYPQQEV